MTRVHRPIQVAMIAGAINTKRHQIIAPMGSGKTGAVLGLANLLSAQRQQWPGLTAFAPLQVALNWRNEAPLWAPRQSVALVAGTLAERKKAVMSDADITLVTYDSVPWMDEFVGGRWSRFGAMAIGDESSRVKSTRAYIEADGSIVTTGGPRTNALARHAADFEWWLNLTGTPVPNGLTDLWGQYFYVDGGQRLMRTYSAFLARWFKSPTRWDDFRKPMPLPGALIEITHAVKDVTTVLKVEDWFKLDKPRFVDRWVELPAKALKQYQDMDISMIMELSSGNIAEVESGSARVAKCLQIACLSGRAKVLTSRGVVALEEVGRDDRVWDGVGWVRHGGLVRKGTRHTIDVHGVAMTADHRVLTPRGWVPADKVINVEQLERPNRRRVREPHGYQARAKPAGASRRYVAMSMCLRERGGATRRSTTASVDYSTERRELRMQARKVERDPRRVRPSEIRAGAPSLRCVGENAKQVQQHGRQRLRQLWGAGHNGFRRLATVCKLSSRHASRLLRGVDSGEERQQRALLEGELPLGYLHRASPQPQGEQAGDAERGYVVCGRGSAAGGIEPRNGPGADRPLWLDRRAGTDAPISSPEGVEGQKEEVFDLVNCGPHRRFAVVCDDERLMLVHNCGFAYYKDDTVDPDANQVEYLHEVKLDALDSIIEETGENLVVVYFFKAQLAQLKARYKDRLRTLDSKGVAQDDWNAGKIELLAVQYSQGSLGISLQHGGRSIVLLAPTNRQEDYEQIIERLGPMRQMQSGYNRVVNVYRILARGTRDKTVFDNTEAKGDFQELTKKLLAEPRVLV